MWQKVTFAACGYDSQNSHFVYKVISWNHIQSHFGNIYKVILGIISTCSKWIRGKYQFLKKKDMCIWTKPKLSTKIELKHVQKRPAEREEKNGDVIKWSKPVVEAPKEGERKIRFTLKRDLRRERTYGDVIKCSKPVVEAPKKTTAPVCLNIHCVNTLSLTDALCVLVCLCVGECAGVWVWVCFPAEIINVHWMRMYIYYYIYTSLYICIHILHVYIYVHMYFHIYIYIYLYVYTYIYVYVYEFTLCKCIYIYINMHIYVHICTHNMYT